MKQRIYFLLRVCGLTLCIFLLAKVAFMLANRGEHPFLAHDVADVLRHGLTLDLSTALYCLIVPFVTVVASIWYTGRGLARALRVWFALVAVAFALAFAADTALYPHWGFKLDATCLQYLSNPAGAAASVRVGWLIAGLVGLVALTAVIAWAYWLQVPSFQPLQGRQRWGMGLCCLVAAPLMFVGIRGGLDKSTTNIGQVYYSENPFFNHSAVNPVFSFLASFEGSVRSDVRYEFFSQQVCDTLLDGLFYTHSTDTDTLLNTQRPNVILVMLESAGGQFTKLGGKDYIMPRFDALTEQGIYFSECYANSFRTDRATVCIWSAYPSFPTMSLQKLPQKNRSLPSIAHSLRSVGYDTHYYYGGDINFTKKKSYLINAGFQRLTAKSDFTRKEQRTAQWGVCDSIVFSRIVEEVRGWEKSAKKPHLIGYNTLSSHQPWDVPTHTLDDPVENAFNYLDQCIGRFVSELRQTPAWDNLLVIFVPDHGVGYGGLDEYSELKMHIPVLWLGGAVREPRVVDVACNQTDLAATLLGQLGIPHDEFRFSRDVLSRDYPARAFAYHTFNNGFSLVDSTRFTVYDLTSDRCVVGDAPDLIQRGKAILQVSSDDLSKR